MSWLCEDVWVSLKSLFKNGLCLKVASKMHALLTRAPALSSALPSLSPVQQAAAQLP